MSTSTQTSNNAVSNILNQFEAPLTIVARVLLALMFLLAGWGKLTGFSQTVAYIQSVGLPAANVMAAAGMVVELGAGLALVFGFQTQIAALLLAGFTLMASFLFHNFWAAPADQAYVMQLMFLKNIAVTGGLLFVALKSKR
ncbi:DoxX family protein [Limnobacter litoralis]|uniref:DoxX family protein n=1 Tax=Limnobacter litoralis TaxID=481366 RepID=A0ABQ5YS77_9BURK|nr:DoxX family protein [Limnobacter litoralis]GLR25654.1 hypothetical protein GCM10007875_07420 [Limnobacter litoralis]